MNLLMLVVETIALLGSALTAGVFFAFSSFVMKALARLPSSEGIAAMQSINIVVINPSFMSVFIGTTLLSLGVAGLALTHWSHPSAIFLFAGAVFYVVGTFLVTILRNVPLNDQLAHLTATDSAARQVWYHYLDRWVMWNHIRTVAAMVAALLFIIGIVQARG